METVKYLIIGGGIAGTTAAETIRQGDKESRVVIVSDEPHRLYSKVLLSKPNYFLGKMPAESIWMKPESWYQDNNIEYLSGKKAVKLNADNRTVALNDGTEFQYEKLLLAVGCQARKLPIPGSDKRGIHHLRTYDDGTGIIEHVKTAKRAIVVGGGFISFEMCEMLRLAGVEVTVVVREPYFWDPLLDEPAGRMVEDVMKKEGVKIILNMVIDEITGGDAVEGVVLKDGTKLECDMIVMGVGTCLTKGWLESSGVEMEHGIKTDEYLATNQADVWAAGDAAEFKDVVLGECIQCGTWVNAMMQGKVAAHNMMGKSEIFKLVSSYTAHGFGLHIAFVGDVMAGPDKETISRGSPESGSYGRLIMLGHELVGGFLVGRGEEVAPLTKLVESSLDVSGMKDKLADPETDLKMLLPS